MAFCMMAFFVIPLTLEAPTILHIWLGIVPDYAVIFMRLVLLISLVNSFSSLLATAKGATGDIKAYQVTLTLIGALHIPFVWIAFKLGGGAEYSMYVYLAIVIVLQAIRIWFVCRGINLCIRSFLNKVIVRCIVVLFLSSILPSVLHFALIPSLLTTILVGVASVISVILSTLYIALTASERKAVMRPLIDRIIK